MPKLNTTLHLDMLKSGKQKRKLNSRIKDDIYGLEWGDPDVSPLLMHVRDHFLKPYISQDTIVVEIDPGGGRWTRYMLDAKRIYAVDYHQELLNELKSNFDVSNITYVKNNGDDFPEIPDASIDFLFSFGTFVHLDIEIIDRYLQKMKRLLKPNSNVVIQYSDTTKPLGKKELPVFSENEPDKMRRLVLSHNYTIYEEDLITLWHSSIVRFGLTREKVSIQ